MKETIVESGGWENEHADELLLHMHMHANLEPSIQVVFIGEALQKL